MSVILETTFGDIVVDLFTAERPRCCLNFLKLCKVKYYNYCIVHNVQKNFVVQMGDPTGSGRGGESVFGVLYGEQAKYFEMERVPKIKHTSVGTVSMVNNGDGMHGSQFLITLGENLDYLDGVHTVFGEVGEGSDVLVKINEALCDDDNRPYIDIRINHTVILDDPYTDPKGLEVPDRSPEPTRQQLESGRIAADEELDETKGKTIEEIEEDIKDKESKARAQVLEMIGDLPDADVRPPDNVLFVCKLNPITSDDDLEIIFSRFGHIISCEVIRDKKSGESLSYAFIEFENVEDCEKAFFKMDNVLIDDRRIHVDFSQSVSRMKWEQKRGKKSDGNHQVDLTSQKSYEKMEAESRGEGKSERKRSGSREREERRKDTGRGRDSRGDRREQQSERRRHGSGERRSRSRERRGGERRRNEGERDHTERKRDEVERGNKERRDGGERYNKERRREGGERDNKERRREGGERDNKERRRDGGERDNKERRRDGGERDNKEKRRDGGERDNKERRRDGGERERKQKTRRRSSSSSS